jgi:Na+-transporting NADH:ubiquinone oxidoreductase subunit NqrE
MKVNLNLDKVVVALTKIKIPYLTVFIAFVSSFNFWFLSIYFFKHDHLTTHGLTITLMTAFALTITWYLICAITVPKDYLLYCFSSGNVELIDGMDDKSFINLFVFAETIIIHSLFLYLTYCFHWTFFVSVSVSFLTVGAKYLLTDIFLRVAYDKYKKGEQEKK